MANPPKVVEVVQPKRQYKKRNYYRKPYPPRDMSGYAENRMNRITGYRRQYASRMNILRPMSGLKYGHLHSHVMFDAGKSSSTNHLNVPMSFGNYLPLQAITRGNITTNTPLGSKQFLLIQFTPTNCSMFIIDGITGNVTQQGSTQLANSVPNQIRVLRQSLQIVNTSVFTSCTGSVRVVSIPEPINFQYSSTTNPTLTSTVLQTIQNIVDTNPSTKTYSAGELIKSHTWVIPPSSFQSYIEYFDYQTLSASGIQTANALSFNYPPQTNISGVYGPPPACMNTLIVEFNQSSSANSYDLTLYQEFACKFSADTIYQNLHIAPKYTSMDAFQKKALEVSASASSGVPTEHLHEAFKEVSEKKGRSNKPGRRSS